MMENVGGFNMECLDVGICSASERVRNKATILRRESKQGKPIWLLFKLRIRVNSVPYPATFVSFVVQNMSPVVHWKLSYFRYSKSRNTSFVFGRAVPEADRDTMQEVTLFKKVSLLHGPT